MVINVDESIRGSFLPLIPEILHGYIESGEAFCLGCVREDMAVGVLVFTVVNGADENGKVCALMELLWIHGDGVSGPFFPLFLGYADKTIMDH